MNLKKEFNWPETEVLVIGGTGSLGKTITRQLLNIYKPKGIRIFSRDELKQWQFRNELAREGFDSGISWLLGDVRDRERIARAMNRATLVFNTAAMKQVPACEDNPFEAIKTNIIGAQNIIDGAIDNHVPLTMHVSTDKAVYPVNLYGGTKQVAEKLFMHGNVYTGAHGVAFSACRYGNVIGSRGSILPLFREQVRSGGKITLTDPSMTRFWIDLPTVADFIIRAATITTGREIFVPVMPASLITDVIKAFETIYDKECPVEIIGIRPGEKIHECLITEEESVGVVVGKKMFVISDCDGGGSRWTYTSENAERLSVSQIISLIRKWEETE